MPISPQELADVRMIEAQKEAAQQQRDKQEAAQSLAYMTDIANRRLARLLGDPRGTQYDWKDLYAGKNRHGWYTRYELRITLPDGVAITFIHEPDILTYTKMFQLSHRNKRELFFGRSRRKFLEAYARVAPLTR